MEDLASAGEAVGCCSQGFGLPHLAITEFPWADDSARLEEFAFRYGRSYDAGLVTEPGWHYFWSRGLRGVVALARSGRCMFSSGGLLAPEGRRGELLAQLVAHASAQRLALAFFNIDEDHLPLCRAFGFQATKWGEEALIDLPACTWAGKDYEWVRRQSNFCCRHGLAVAECRRDLLSAAEWQALAGELSEVSGLFLDDKAQANEMRFLQAGFDPRRLGRKRVFVARNEGGDGRIEGFLACHPLEGGRTWTLETFRQRPDAVRGTVPFLMHQAMQILRSDGVQRVSLCLIPGLRCREPLPGDSAMARWGLVLASRYCNLVFDTAGAFHFKSRFRPRFEDRYLCVRPRMNLSVALAFIRLLGVLRLDVRKFCQLAVRRWHKRAARATLWTPEAEAAKLDADGGSSSTGCGTSSRW